MKIRRGEGLASLSLTVFSQEPSISTNDDFTNTVSLALYHTD